MADAGFNALLSCFASLGAVREKFLIRSDSGLVFQAGVALHSVIPMLLRKN